jgi:hypothetical protein
VDVDWLKQGGGFIKSKHAAAGRFNLGEKLVYWLSLAAGVAVSVSGFLLLFPFAGTNIADVQLAQVVHAVVAVLFIALILPTSTSARSGWRVRSKPWAPERSISTGRRSITISGSPSRSRRSTDQDIRQPRPRNKRHRTLIYLRGPSWRDHRTFTGQLVNVHHLTHHNNISCAQIWGVCEMPML